MTSIYSIEKLEKHTTALMIKKIPKIFIAHASEDKPQVRKLYAKLREAGYKPWLDEEDLLPGQFWRDEIPKVLRNSDLFLACLSLTSIRKRGYIQREFRMAMEMLGEFPPGTIYLIPLKFDDCEIPDLRQSEYGLNLRDIHWLDYWKPNGFNKLVKAIDYQFGSQENNLDEYKDRKKKTNDVRLQQFEFEIVTVDQKGEENSRTRKSAEFNYKSLENLLTAKKWQEADQETLKILLKVTQREEEGWLRAKDIEQLPCSIIYYVDQLWREKSNDKFAFSRQVVIWRKICNQAGNSDNEKFNQFGDFVGWRDKSSWLNYHQFQFTDQAPLGHLPSLREFGEEKKLNSFSTWFSNYPRFLARIDICWQR